MRIASGLSRKVGWPAGWIVALAAMLSCSPAAAQTPRAASATMTVQADAPGPVIAPEIYGHFVEHLGRGVYEGIWVGPDSPIPNIRGVRSDVVAALREVAAPVIRWPGGCFADSYHWRDGLGPLDQRPAGINASWRDTPEPNTFGTHEYFDFMEQVGAAPFISVNVGSGSVREADEWMRYITAPSATAPGQERAANGRAEPWNIPFIGVGNETWGCGGNMTAETYAAEFRRYAAFLRNYTGERAKLIAVGADTDDYAWTETMMAQAVTWRPDPTPLAYTSDRPLMWGLSLHFYTFAGDDWANKGRNVGFGEDGWAAALARANLTDDLIRRHSEIMDRYDPEKRVALVVDEWGGWFASEPDAPSQLYLESTLRDAIIAGLSLNIFNQHADRVRMANIAQMVNVIQALILTRGADMVVTPTWHVFNLYKPHHGATMVPVQVAAPDYTHGDVRLPGLNASASRDAQGRLHVSIVNLDPHRPARISATLAGATGTRAAARTITAEAITTKVEFDAADPFVPRVIEGVTLTDELLTLTVPPRSVTMVEVQ